MLVKLFILERFKTIIYVTLTCIYFQIFPKVHLDLVFEICFNKVIFYKSGQLSATLVNLYF